MELYDFFLYNMIPLVIAYIRKLYKKKLIVCEILYFILMHFDVKYKVTS